MSNYNNALAEVDTILSYLNESEFQKIPPSFIKAIKDNKNNNYMYDFNVNTELRKQKMLPETKAILYNLFRDYLSTPEQKEKIIRMQREDRIKTEEKKKQEYQANFINGSEEIFKNKQYEKVESTQIIQYKKSLFEKIINKIKSIFKIE